MNRINKELFEDLTVLYVEDDEMTSEEVSFFLSKYVKTLYVASNGEEGFELFKKYQPNLVITDIQMPIKNGLEMSKEILNHTPNTPIIITTAYSDADYLINAIELGIDKYILKPIKLLELLILIQKSLYLECKNSKFYEEYIQFILDSNSSFMFITDSQKIEYVNENLLKLLGENSIHSIKEKFNKCKNLFLLENVKTDLNYIDYILQNPEKTYLVSLNSEICKSFSNKKFYVKYKYFDDMKKSIFIFNEVENEKLEKIKKIIEKMSSENNNINIIEELKKVI